MSSVLPPASKTMSENDYEFTSAYDKFVEPPPGVARKLQYAFGPLGAAKIYDLERDAWYGSRCGECAALACAARVQHFSDIICQAPTSTCAGACFLSLVFPTALCGVTCLPCAPCEKSDSYAKKFFKMSGLLCLSGGLSLGDALLTTATFPCGITCPELAGAAGMHDIKAGIQRTQIKLGEKREELPSTER